MRTERIRSELFGEFTVEVLEEWTVPRMWNLHRVIMGKVIQPVCGFKFILATDNLDQKVFEFSEAWTAEDLQRALPDLAESISIVVPGAGWEEPNAIIL